jgi:hypothetical protein
MLQKEKENRQECDDEIGNRRSSVWYWNGPISSIVGHDNRLLEIETLEICVLMPEKKNLRVATLSFRRNTHREDGFRSSVQIYGSTRWTPTTITTIAPVFWIHGMNETRELQIRLIYHVYKKKKKKKKKKYGWTKKDVAYN